MLVEKINYTTLIEQLSTNYFQLMRDLPADKRLQLFHRINNGTCPECAGVVFLKENGEKACINCGDAKNIESYEPDFAQTSNGSPACKMAFGNSLGNTLRCESSGRYARDLYQVLAKAPAGTEDIGLRARFIRIYTSTTEHPTVKKMLEAGARRTREFLPNEDSDISRRFVDVYAEKLRYIGGFLTLGSLKPKTGLIVDATFVRCLKEFGMIKQMNDAWDKLKINENILEAVGLFFTLPKVLGA